MPFIETSDRTSLFYKDWCTGKPVLFLHGWCLDANMWEYQMKPPADLDLWCIAYDVRGCGRSNQPGYGYDLDTLADDLAAVIEHLDLRDATLVGHSAGDPLPTGNVLVVGAGNSGAEASVKLSSAGRRVWLSGRGVGRIPFGLGNRFTWWLFSSVLTSGSRL